MFTETDHVLAPKESQYIPGAKFHAEWVAMFGLCFRGPFAPCSKRPPWLDLAAGSPCPSAVPWVQPDGPPSDSRRRESEVQGFDPSWWTLRLAASSAEASALLRDRSLPWPPLLQSGPHVAQPWPLPPTYTFVNSTFIKWPNLSHLLPARVLTEYRLCSQTTGQSNSRLVTKGYNKKKYDWNVNDMIK